MSNMSMYRTFSAFVQPLGLVFPQTLSLLTLRMNVRVSSLSVPPPLSLSSCLRKVSSSWVRLVLARLEARLRGGGGGLWRLGEAGPLLGLEVGDGA